IWLMNMHYREKVNEITFVSFDNLDLFDYSLPKVISVAQPIENIAEESVGILAELMQTKENTNKRIELKPKLIER
ncbi:substrate-binding domain-containing protein, partial [Labilibaculum sp.]|uniref:substrate-binding domain-containing protein n=1 Tax=Labilibaculum sp. TaxID=2060723 RepID=UPI003562C972